MTTLVTKVLLTGALAGFAAAAGAAPAQADAPSLVVHYSSGALATDTGARAVYHRIALAAEQVCPAPTDVHFIPEGVAKCREQAIAAAVGKIHNQRLAAVYASHAKSG